MDDQTPAGTHGHQNRRVHQRRRTLLGGKIVVNHLSTIDCRVRDLSDHGAQLLVATSVGVPDRFELRLDRENRYISARIVWRKADRIGVVFETPADGPPTTSEPPAKGPPAAA